MILTQKEILIRKFGSIASFAKAINWSNRKAYDIVNGKQEPTASEMAVMAEVAGINTAEEFIDFFYNTYPQSGQ